MQEHCVHKALPGTSFWRASALAAALTVLLTLLAGPLAARGEGGFVVIVNQDVPVDSLKREELGRIFRKAITFWPDGTRIMPVELGGQSPTRSVFYQDTMDIRVSDVAAFWINQAMTTGIEPPRTMPTDALVVGYVARTAGAIGFVSEQAPLDPRVKSVTLR